MSAATPATCGADADVPKKFGNSSAGSSRHGVMKVLVGLLQWSPSSSSNDESAKKTVVLPPSGPVTRGFGRSAGTASGAPYLSRYVGMPPADEKSRSEERR